ncbi:RagB/SusD family nutrient uptake outer membrane protein [Seonamhaeicola algicola]|uniref:RagB/SusD family nutrient uptake outer membrane protein n=1 Tax=Seonamhaeicola algicola TaxID=1719036 RepID=A0A5C7ATK9_9FLAO|nr:RagB/SusD family nutrient uptake outer membrane protein [Seonamhaeicola algicola]TXE09825.1 RagB/SusD family nutrient uptake outer membrane protein [Seonamhaeicola algicola]
MKKFKFLFIILLGGLFSCEEDFLDTEPANSISDEQVASTPAANEAILRGIYANLRSFGVGNPARVDVDYGQKGIMAITDMMGQDIVLNNFNWYIFLYNYNGRQQTSSRTNIVWNTYYTAIADANIVINGLQDKEFRTASEDALLGQALAIKSFSLFNLVRVYSDTYIGNENSPGVPIPDRVDFSGKSRGTVQDVYDQIIPDLELAKTLLDGYSRANKQEIDKNVVEGFLANVYLETGNWQLAADNAAAARSSYTLMPGENYATDGFDDINNVEWMWGADIDNLTSTTFISFFSHFDSTADGYGGVGFGFGFKMIDARLYDQIPDTDLRKAAWIDPVDGNPDFPAEEGYIGYANVKFIDAGGSFEGDYSYMRSAEMYLIEAEAKARLGDATAADVLFELVSNRDPGYTKSTNTGMDLVEEIYLQRRIELWGEGVSWFDLKRLKKPLDRTGEGSNHRSFGAIDIPVGGDFFKMQIPQGEINSNPNINVGDQNP